MLCWHSLSAQQQQQQHHCMVFPPVRLWVLLLSRHTVHWAATHAAGRRGAAGLQTTALFT